MNSSPIPMAAGEESNGRPAGDPLRTAIRAPSRGVEALRYEAGAAARSVHEQLAEEVPVAMLYNGRPHAVMLATPADLEDFAYGFSLTEGIVAEVAELTLADQVWTEHGVALEMLLPAKRLAPLQGRERSLTGRTGCGLCGTATLEAAIRPVRRHAGGASPFTPVAVAEALERLEREQPINRISGAVHAAAILSQEGTFTVREDVGRHNAIDKAVGAVMRMGGRPHALFVTSRASYEVVHKAAEVGCSLVAAVSAPTALAWRLAEEAGITLVGWARPPRLTVYCGALA